MKLAFLKPRQTTEQQEERSKKIVAYLSKKGHDVQEAPFYQKLPQQHESYYQKFYRILNTRELVIAECTTPCITLGYDIAFALQQGKEIIILKEKVRYEIQQSYDPLSMHKNIYVYEYLQHNLFEILQEALDFNPCQKYKKYNILFTPDMIAKLNDIARKKNLPKSVYIRQLIEQGLSSEES